MTSFNIYMAGPVFTMAERAFNERLANALNALIPGATCLLPQIEAEKFLPSVSRMAFECLRQINSSAVVIACLDGADVDSGTAFEVGYALANKIPIIGYRTDFRGGEVDGVNAMLHYACSLYIDAPQRISDEQQLANILAPAISNFANKLCTTLEDGR